MAIKITSVKEALDNNGLKVLVYGDAGAGKTVLSATTGAPTLIVSAESGLLSIRNAPAYIEVTRVETIQDLEQVYAELESGTLLNKYKWIGLDSISEIAEVLLSEEKAKNKDPRQSYGNLEERIMKILRAFRDLPTNVFMTCKMKRQEDADSGLVTFVPALPGKALTNAIPYLFDEVFVLHINRKQLPDGTYFEERVLQTGKDRKYHAKDRSGELEFYEEPSLKKIAAKIWASIPEPVRVEKEVSAFDEQEVDEHDVSQVGNDENSVKLSETKPEDVKAALGIDPDLTEMKSKKYWVHHESGSVGVFEKGEKVNTVKFEAQGAELCSKEDHDKFAEQYSA